MQNAFLDILSCFAIILTTAYFAGSRKDYHPIVQKAWHEADQSFLNLVRAILQNRFTSVVDMSGKVMGFFAVLSLACTIVPVLIFKTQPPLPLSLLFTASFLGWYSVQWFRGKGVTEFLKGTFFPALTIFLLPLVDWLGEGHSIYLVASGLDYPARILFGSPLTSIQNPWAIAAILYAIFSAAILFVLLGSYLIFMPIMIGVCVLSLAVVVTAHALNWLSQNRPLHPFLLTISAAATVYFSLLR